MEYENPVYYSEEEFNLCRTHHNEWMKEHTPYIEEHKDIKPITNAWTKMCEEEERLFKKWFKKQGTPDAEETWNRLN